jgi:predicted small metal-binding protein
MNKTVFTAILAVLLVLAFSTVTFAQDKTDMQGKKTEMKGMMKDKMNKAGEMGKSGLMSFSCDPACGFSVRSHDEAEIISMVKEHAKTHHNMEMTDAQIKEKIKPAGMMMHEKMMDKKMDKAPDSKKPDGY